MRKIRVQIKNGVYGVAPMRYNITEVTEETYKIIERKVIESATKSVELQIFLQTTNITLPKLMETSITQEMVHEAITESINDLKQKK